MMRLLDKIGDKIANVEEDFQKKQSSRNSRNRYRDRTQEIVTGIEVEIEEDQTQERIETTNKDQVQVKDMIEKISVTTVIEQVIQHMSVLNLRTI